MLYDITQPYNLPIPNFQAALRHRRTFMVSKVKGQPFGKLG